MQQRVGLISKTPLVSAALMSLSRLCPSNEGVTDTERSWVDFFSFYFAAAEMPTSFTRCCSSTQPLQTAGCRLDVPCLPSRGCCAAPCRGQWGRAGTGAPAGTAPAPVPIGAAWFSSGLRCPSTQRG